MDGNNLNALIERYEAFKARGLRLDMSRGKPEARQLDPVSYTHLRAHET